MRIGITPSVLCKFSFRCLLDSQKRCGISRWTMTLNLRKGVWTEDINVGADQHTEMNKCQLERLFCLILPPALWGSNYTYYSHVIEQETEAKKLRPVQHHSAVVELRGEKKRSNWLQWPWLFSTGVRRRNRSTWILKWIFSQFSQGWYITMAILDALERS